MRYIFQNFFHHYLGIHQLALSVKYNNGFSKYQVVKLIESSKRSNGAGQTGEK